MASMIQWLTCISGKRYGVEKNIEVTSRRTVGQRRAVCIRRFSLTGAAMDGAFGMPGHSQHRGSALYDRGLSTAVAWPLQQLPNAHAQLSP